MFPPDYFPGKTGHPAASVALFINADTTTQGNWTGAYGVDGYVMAGRAASPPTYASAGVSTTLECVWDTATASGPALADPAKSGGRIAACWFTPNPQGSDSLSVNANMTDGRAHRVALYALDWDKGARSERVDVIDDNTGVVLDSRDLTGFSNGTYLVWYVKGSITFRISNVPPSLNAVVSGIFFG